MTFKENSKQELTDLVASGSLDFYDKYEDIEQVIQEVFELNPHSVHTLNKHKEGIYAIALDNLNIVYTMDEKKTEVHIVKVLYSDNHALDDSSFSSNPSGKKRGRPQAPQDKLRTKQWLEKMSEIMDFRGIKVENQDQNDDEKEDAHESNEQKDEDSPEQIKDGVVPASKYEEEKEAS